MKTEAAVLWRPGEPVEIADVGEGVRSLVPGDRVVLALVPSCGECAECRRGRPNFCELGARMAASGTLADGTSRLSLNGTKLHHFNSVSSFAGCAVLTGCGAVFNTAGVQEGASVAVWGAGGVGLNVIQGARLAGATQIVAVDIRRKKLELARSVGATDTVLADPATDVVAAVRDITGGGPDYAFEAIGTERTIQQAWQAAGPRSTVIVVGIMPKGSTLTIDPWQFFSEKTLKGSFLGSSNVRDDVPRLADLYASGELKLDELVSRRIPLDRLPEALDRLRAGEELRQLVVFE